MTPATEKLIRERAEKATPGPWTKKMGTVYPEGPQPGAEPLVDPIDGNAVAYGIWPILSGENADADADFIAHAREDIDTLLAILDAERQRAGALAEALQQMLGHTRHLDGNYCAVFRGLGRTCDCGWYPAAANANAALRAHREARP